MRKAIVYGLAVVFILGMSVRTKAEGRTNYDQVGQPATPWSNQATQRDAVTVRTEVRSAIMTAGATAVGDPVNFDTALSAAADYLRGMQADVTEDNAGNGTNGVDEIPDDPDDGGWDWVVTSPPAPFSHTTAASPTNIYGISAQGVYYAYKKTGDASYFTAMTDAANVMMVDRNTHRSAPDIEFLLLYNDLLLVPGTAYADSAKAKFDARVATYGSATALAEYIRDQRGVTQGYPNGIIAWDIGTWVRAAAMLAARYPSDPNNYAQAATDMAEVLWQDSFNGNPGLFDVVADAGWDPTYADVNFWWYTLGVSGLVNAFDASGSHTAEIPGLVTRLRDSQYPTGAVSFSYGANAGDEDWQSTAYAAMALAQLDQSAHQSTINHMAYWIGATQDISGGWKYGDDTHYPEIGSENARALAFALPPSVVIVDDDFTGQNDVDLYNTANGTNYVWGYDAFNTVQNGVNAVGGSTVMVLAGIYEEQVEISKPLTLVGAGQGVTIIQSPVTLPLSFTTGAANKPIIFVHDADSVVIQDLTVDGLGRGNTNYRFVGVAYFNAGGTIDNCEVANVRDTPISGTQHGIGIYGYVDAIPNRAMEVTNCWVHDFQKGGITLNGAGLSGTISGCNVDGYGPASFIAMNGIQIGFGADGTISNNQVYGCSYTGTGWSSTGVLLYNCAGPITCNYNLVEESQVGIWYINTGGEISQNTVTATPAGTGLTSYWSIVADPGGPPQGRQPTPQPFDAAATASGGGTGALSTQLITTLVKENEVDGGGSGTGIEADALGTETLDFTATGNIATNFEAALVVYKESGATLNTTINNNSLTNSTYGFYNQTGEPHDVRANYWGDLTGPMEATTNPTGLGDAVSGSPTTGDVLYAPWLGLADADTFTPGYQPPAPMTWGLNTQTTLLDAYNTFTAAGDAIFMRTGNYSEGPQLVIDHDISVFGEEKTTTVITPSGNTGSSGDARGWFLVNSGVTLTLDSLTLDGSGHLVYQAIRSWGGGTIDNVDFRHISFSQYMGVGVAVAGNDNMTVSNCTFADIQRIGVLFFGSGVTNAIFADNTYTGKGVGDWLDYAVEFGAGAVGQVLNNVITDCLGVASVDGSTSAGVIVTTFYGPGTTVTLEQDSIANCTAGIAVGYDGNDASTLTIRNGNKFFDNGTGITTATSPTIGLTVYGNIFSNTVNAEDNTSGGNWDDGVSVGNCWSDFAANSGYPAQYNVPGSAGAIDHFPNSGNDCPFCACPFQGDLDANGVVDAIDLSDEINIIYFNASDIQDPTCPTTRADFNGDGVTDAIDLSELINMVYFGGAAPADPCAL